MMTSHHERSILSIQRTGQNIQDPDHEVWTSKPDHLRWAYKAIHFRHLDFTSRLSEFFSLACIAFD